MFFFRTKTIVVDTFTKHAGVGTYYPIEPASKHLPTWFKKLPSKYVRVNEYGSPFPQATIKRCDGVLELFRKSFIMPMWCDVNLSINENGDWFYNYPSGDLDLSIQSHDRAQYGEFFNNHIHIKLQNPWVIKEKTGVNFHFSSPFWDQFNVLRGVYTPTAIVNFKYQSNASLNIFVDKQTQQIHLPAGLPVISLVPMTEKKVVIKTHIVSDQEFERFNQLSYTSSFIGKYKLHKNIIDSREKKCPFGFGK